ncbi:MAG: hypothetical protein JW939_10005 [Candidatus Thermoplasmatota archaeon]|nr:hypothetical protein [Candidatus Thermoplasmatota archaeon]
MIVAKDLLIPMFNREIFKGTERFDVYEGWRGDIPLFSGHYSECRMRVDSIGKNDYRSLMPEAQEIPGYLDLNQKVIQASGMIDPSMLSGYRERFGKIVDDDEPFRRNVRFYYDTNSLMNNYFFLFREYIPDFTRKAFHNTSLGVVSELEDIFDRKLKGHFFPDHFREVYGRDDEIFHSQPNLYGRSARLAYSEIEYLKKKLRVNILTDDGVGDRNILGSFARDSQKFNLDGVLVTNDHIMAERAGMRMGSWLVRFDLSNVKGLRTRLEYFIEAVYRAAIIYGRVRVNDDMIVSGLWSRKRQEDWNSGHIMVEGCSEGDIERTLNIMAKVPEDFYGKSYYS